MLTPLEIAVLVIVTLALAALVAMEIAHERWKRDRAELQRLRTERGAAADAAARLEAMARRVRVYDPGSLGPYPEQRPGPGVLAVTRYHARRLVTETEEHLRRPGA